MAGNDSSGHGPGHTSRSHGWEGGGRQGRGRDHGPGKGEKSDRGRGRGCGCAPGRGRGGRRGRIRDDDGRFVETAEGSDVLGVFDAVDGPVVTTTDVSDVLGITTESARQKLNGLVTEGQLRRRKTGRTVVYWQADGGREER